MTNILWLSRHEPMNAQELELVEKFGNVSIDQKELKVDDAMEIIELIEEGKYDEVVVVLPIHLMSELNDLGVQPLVAIMDRWFKSEDEPVFEHRKFIRLNDIVIEDLIKN